MITFVYVDSESVEHILELPDPDWIKDYVKIQNVVIRRAMSGKLRTYVVRDRKYSHAITYSMKFVLHRLEMRLAKKFIKLSDGHYIWVRGLESNVGAKIAEAASAGDRSVKLQTVSGSISVGDFANIDGNYYTIVGVSDRGITIKPGLIGGVGSGLSVTILKQQMSIISNQQVDFGSEDRAAGDENKSGKLMDVEDETYTLTLAILVIRT